MPLPKLVLKGSYAVLVRPSCHLVFVGAILTMIPVSSPLPHLLSWLLLLCLYYNTCTADPVSSQDTSFTLGRHVAFKNNTTIPPVFVMRCIQIRALLKTHATLSLKDLQYMPMFTAFAVTLCVTGFPGLPVAIIAYCTRRRLHSSQTFRQLTNWSVSASNFVLVDRMCAVLVAQPEVDPDATNAFLTVAQSMPHYAPISSLPLSISVIVSIVELAAISYGAFLHVRGRLRKVQTDRSAWMMFLSLFKMWYRKPEQPLGFASSANHVAESHSSMPLSELSEYPPTEASPLSDKSPFIRTFTSYTHPLKNVSSSRLRSVSDNPMSRPQSQMQHRQGRSHLHTTEFDVDDDASNAVPIS